MFLHLLLVISFFGMNAAEEKLIDPIATSDIETTGNMDNDYSELPEGIESTDGMDTDPAGDINTSDIIDSNDDIDVADSNVPTDNDYSAEGIDATGDIDSNDDFYFTSDIDSIENPGSTEEMESASIDSTGDIDLFENIGPPDEADIDSTGYIGPIDSSDATDDIGIAELVDSTGDIDSTDKGDLRADIEIDATTEDDNKDLTPNGFSKKRMQRFCAHVVKGSKPIDTHTCRYVTCDRNGYKTGAHVFNANICPVGQFCKAGTCISMVPERPKEALTNEEWKIVSAECKKKFGKIFGPYCSETNIATHPDIAINCKNDLCDAMLCAGIKHRRVRFTWAYLDVGSKCEFKKSCNKYKHCERDDWVESL